MCAARRAGYGQAGKRASRGEAAGIRMTAAREWAARWAARWAAKKIRRVGRPSRIPVPLRRLRWILLVP